MGEYKVRCAELCGVQHAYMESPVKIVSQADYDKWVNEQTGPSDDPVVRGKKAAKQYGCIACHSTDGSKLVGPTWKGLYGHDVPLEDGSSVKADDAYLKESIVQPGAKIVQGFGNIMPPTYQTQLSDEQIEDIIKFINSLK